MRTKGKEHLAKLAMPKVFRVATCCMKSGKIFDPFFSSTKSPQIHVARQFPRNSKNQNSGTPSGELGDFIPLEQAREPEGVISRGNVSKAGEIILRD
ncbi:hypothetical protein Q3G72_009443 [Acer saccharum]|nr:hypothetical protein Q3G72_009443 [Acer saccharum]